MSIELIVDPVTRVHLTALGRPGALAVSFVVHKLARVHSASTVGVVERAIAVHFAITPFSFINITVFGHKYAIEAMHLAAGIVATIARAVGEK